jgi:hypothetical protein
MRFWLEIPWLPDTFHWERWDCSLGRPGRASELHKGWVVEPPRRGLIRDVMGLFTSALALLSGRAGA